MNEIRTTSTRRKVVTRGGALLIAASAAITGFLHTWEDGGKTKFTVYADQLAGGIPTACYGITQAVTDRPVRVGDVWSQEKCDAVEEEVIAKTQEGLARCITGRITQNAFDAVSSLAHNVGVGAVCSSSTVKLINAGQLEAGCHAISTRPDGSPNWSYVGQKFYQGLHNRRLAETALCLAPDQPA